MSGSSKLPSESPTDPQVDTADSGEIEWAGTVSRKPPHAEEGDERPASDEPDPLDEAERVGDHRYPG